MRLVGLLRISALSGALFCAVAACGSQLSEGDARVVWSNIESALRTQGASQALSTDVDLTISCRDGGTLLYRGSLDADGNDTGGQAAFAYEATFDACASQGDTLDGSLEYSNIMASTTAEDGTQVAAQILYSGSFVVTGVHDGACDVDMQASFSATQSGQLGAATFTYSGTLCGHDASRTLNASFGL